MSPRGQGRTASCSPQQARERLRQASGFLWWARTASEDVSDPINADVAASLAVLAGIAACDAICGNVLGYYSRSQNHADAAALLRSIEPGGAQLASKFRRLVATKDDAQYAPDTLSATAARTAVRHAGDLVEAALALAAGR